MKMYAISPIVEHLFSKPDHSKARKLIINNNRSNRKCFSWKNPMVSNSTSEF
jgi:hypothetical protein